MTIQRVCRSMKPIKELVIRGSADVYVKRGEPSMLVIADRPEEVITEFRSGILSISQNPFLSIGGAVMIGQCWGASHIFHGNRGDFVVGDTVMVCGKRPVVEISLPELSVARIEGSGDLSLEDLAQDSVELEITGSGTIRAYGKVLRLDAVISGSGDVKAKDLQASVAVLRLSGSGEIKAIATQSLSARLSGSGDIKVWGSPAKQDIRVSGSGDILVN